jgi:hypothetical protein
MRDIFGDRMLRSDVGDANIRSLASLAQGVVTRIEVFSLL